MWIMTLTLIALAAILTLVKWAHTRRRETDLGSVSDQWVSEARLSQKQDAQR